MWDEDEFRRLWEVDKPSALSYGRKAALDKEISYSRFINILHQLRSEEQAIHALLTNKSITEPKMNNEDTLDTLKELAKQAGSYDETWARIERAYLRGIISYEELMNFSAQISHLAHMTSNELKSTSYYSDGRASYLG